MAVTTAVATIGRLLLAYATKRPTTTVMACHYLSQSEDQSAVTPVQSPYSNLKQI